MELLELINKINEFKNRDTTSQSYRKEKYHYENDYIRILRIDTSNIQGGKKMFNGKQWSIIIDKKIDFCHLENWHLLKSVFNTDLKVTNVSKGEYKGKYGIRFYNMSIDPTNEIIENIMDFLFSK